MKLNKLKKEIVKDNNNLVLFLPGLSLNLDFQNSSPYINRFAKEINYNLFIYTYDFQITDNFNLTLTDCINELQDLLTELKKKYSKIIVFAKSFSGFLINFIKTDLQHVFLLGPAINIGKRMDYNQKLKDISMKEITIQEEDVIKDSTFIVGEFDTFNIKYSKTIPIHIIKGEGHTFKNQNNSKKYSI